MAERLSKRAVEGLLPASKAFVIWDGELPGFGVRVMPNGSKFFCAKLRMGRGRAAKQRWISIGRFGPMTTEAARREAKSIFARALVGAEPSSRKQISPAEAMTVAALCEKWLNGAALRSRGRGRLYGALRDPKNVALDKGRIDAHIVPVIGKVRLAELKTHHVTQLRDAIAAGKTRKTEKTRPRGKRIVRGGEGAASRTLRQLSSILSYGVREGLLPANPALGVERSPDRSLERFMSPAEAVRLGKALNQAEMEGQHPSGLSIIRLLALSGARKSEIETLRWGDVDLTHGFLTIARSKTGSRTIPLTAPMRAVLERVPNVEGTDYVFPSATLRSPYAGTPKIWKLVRSKAGLEDLRLHDLRHSAASFALSSGVGLEVIGRLLGHADVKTTRRYAHLADDIARAAAERTASTIDVLMPLNDLEVTTDA